MSKVLAFDLSASCGQAVLGDYKDGRITMEEVHHFSNDPVYVLGTLYWDVLRLFYEIKRGIAKAAQIGPFVSLGIDTWGGDFGLLRPDGDLVGNPVHFDDHRTEDYDLCPVQPEDAYKVTGIEVIYFNSLYQLNAMARKQPAVLAGSARLLFMPDLFSYMLGANRSSEYTIASTSGMLNAKTKEWDDEILTKAAIPERLFCDIVMPGTLSGVLSTEICAELGAPTAKLVSVASHDTASAVAVVPTQDEHFVFLNCGPKSQLGTVLEEPLINEKTFDYEFANEGTVDGKIQFVKNVMGIWLIDECLRQWALDEHSYSATHLQRLAAEAKPFKAFIDVDDAAFTKAKNLPQSIQSYCESTKQEVPQTPGEIARCVYESLALKYRYTLDCLRDCIKKEYDCLHIIGDGAGDALLCQLVSSATQLDVIAGPQTATILGNIGVQLITMDEIESLSALRDIVANSYGLASFHPQKPDSWNEAYKRYVDIVLASHTSEE